MGEQCAILFCYLLWFERSLKDDVCDLSCPTSINPVLSKIVLVVKVNSSKVQVVNSVPKPTSQKMSSFIEITAVRNDTDEESVLEKYKLTSDQMVPVKTIHKPNGKLSSVA